MAKTKQQQVVHSFAKQDQEQRGAAADVGRELAACLADTYVLTLKTHGYHWNVEGPHFPSLHQLLEEQYQELFLAADEVAERLRSLGEFAPGSFEQMRQLSRIVEAGDPPFSEGQIIQDLTNDHQAMATALRKAIAVCEEHDDMGTADLFTNRLKAHEKAAWMLRSTKI